MKIQKIQSGAKNTKGFTLVELIVVITILAILGTIAFISLNGQSASARDSKRKTDLSSIMSKSMIVQTQGVDPLSLITADATRSNTTMPLAGSGGALNPSKYIAGTPNYVAIGVSSTDFKDTKANKAYSMAATTLAGGALQLAATLENDSSGNPTSTALVVGNYIKRAAVGTAFSSVTSTGSDNKTLTISNNFGLLKSGDTVTVCGASNTISSISADLKTIGLTTACAAAAVNVGLATAEGDSLIGTGAASAYVTDNQSTILPY